MINSLAASGKIPKGHVILRAYAMKPKHRQIREVTLHSIELDACRPAPSGMLILYGGGANAAMKMLGDVLREGGSYGQVPYPINVLVDVDAVAPEFATHVDLELTRVLDFTRASLEVRHTVQHYWRGYLADEKYSEQWITENIAWRHGSFISDRPDLLGRLFAEKEFSHLAVFKFNFFHLGHLYKLAVVPDPAAIKGLACPLSPSIDVRWMESVYKADGSIEMASSAST